jgi:hypothetical protein
LVQAAVGLGLGAAAGVLFAVWYLGSFDPWTQWATVVLPDLAARRDLTTVNGNYAPAELIFEITGHPASTLLAILSLGAIAIGFLRGATSRPALTLALGSAAMLLSSKLVWFHYQTLFLPLLIYIFATTQPRPPQVLTLSTLALVCLVTNPSWWPPGYPLQYYINSAGSLALFAAGLVIFYRRLPGEPL